MLAHWEPSTFQRIEVYVDIPTGDVRDEPTDNDPGKWIALISEGSPPVFLCMVDLITYHQDVCIEDDRYHRPDNLYYPIAVGINIDVALEEGVKIIRQWLKSSGDICTKVPPPVCWIDVPQ